VFLAKRPPTDFQLLKTIYVMHRGEYAKEVHKREAAILVPIDIPAVADRLGIETHSVFGRLYYDLDKRYGEEPEPGRPRKVFFTLRAGTHANCVNFPHLEAVLAGLWLERRRNGWTVGTALLSFALALASLIYSIGWA
jgi:hypothetical protein